MKHWLVLACLAIIPGTVFAQEVPRFAFSGGAGFVTPVYDAGRTFDTGWDLRFGAGVNIIPNAGVMLDLGYDSMGVNSTTLGNLGYGGGRLGVFSVSLDPIIHLTPHSKADFYITGGPGYYHLNDYFSMNNGAIGTVGGTMVGNPFLGFFNGNVSNYSLNKLGVDAGAGVEFGSKWHGRFFAEARFTRIFTSGAYTDYIPVTFGFRR